MTTKEIIFGMLTENTGAHFLDSGGAYGRAWERNQGKTMADFEAEPEQQFTYHKHGNYLERRVSVFHYLSQLQTDWICDYFNAMPCGDWDADNEEVHGVSQFQWDWLTNKCEVEVNYGFNTYNGDSDLSQILQGSWLTINDEQYLLLQIHGGCDARGGYTNAKLFQCQEEWMIHEYLREYMDSYETDEELREGYIDAVDGDDPTITYTSDQLIDMMSESGVADDTDIKMRTCTKCGSSMEDGYVFRSGEEYACSDDCRDAICRDNYKTTWVEECDDDSYFTEFNK
jgi:hypothetical protein